MTLDDKIEKNWHHLLSSGIRTDETKFERAAVARRSLKKYLDSEKTISMDCGAYHCAYELDRYFLNKIAVTSVSFSEKKLSFSNNSSG